MKGVSTALNVEDIQQSDSDICKEQGFFFFWWKLTTDSKM